jgi:TPR repeat protein/serine/threonine protein kinase
MENAPAAAKQSDLARSLCMGCMAPATDGAYCPNCGWGRSAPAESVLHLAPGTVLHNYIVGKVLGQGGFGITYIGWDIQLHRKVAIKEYFPQIIASRIPGAATVAPTGSRASGDFQHGLQSFMNEGRILARFSDHPCIVSVINLFEANQTGYLVMGYLDGVTLSEAIVNRGGRLSYESAREVMLRVMDGLREVHAQGLLHRDISPDNIYVTRQGPIKILDFGAARMAVGERSQSLSVVLKEGYAPEEQYRRNGNQGPWTDIYAAAATFYRAITGITPPPALDRLADDRLVRPSVYCPNMPVEAERAILKALSIDANSRYHTIDQFQQGLADRRVDPPIPAPVPIPVPAPTPVPAPVPGPPDYKTRGAEPKDKSLRLAVYVAVACVVLLLGGGWFGHGLLISHYESQGEQYYRSANLTQAVYYFQKAADAGNPAGEMYLGRLYALGNGIGHDFDRARGLFEKSAAAGNVEAMDNLGFLYDNGFGVTKDYKQAAQWYRKAADAGSADAMVRLGVLYHNGWGFDRDYNQARQWYEKAAEGGNTRGMTNLGLMYEDGLSVTRDYNRARELYQKAGDAGSPAGMTLLGILYDDGLGVTRDAEMARHWYEKASAAGDPIAMNYLGAIYGRGRGVDRDYAQQRAWYEKSAEMAIPWAVDVKVNEHRIAQGRSEAELALGDISRNGLGATPDFMQARRWYDKSFADGDADGAARIGQMYFFGQGVLKDYGQAREWYEKAAGMGNSNAMNDLGVLYFNGQGVPQSYEKAREWDEKSAAAGNATAMKNLGNIYEYGDGVAVDKVKAEEWYEKAADAGNIDASVLLGQRVLDRSNDRRTSLSDQAALLPKLERARQWAQRGADAGDARSIVLLRDLNASIQRIQGR